MFSRKHYDYLAGNARMLDPASQTVVVPWLVSILKAADAHFDQTRFEKVAYGRSTPKKLTRSTAPYSYRYIVASSETTGLWFVYHNGKIIDDGGFGSSAAAAQWIYDKLDDDKVQILRTRLLDAAKAKGYDTSREAPVAQLDQGGDQ